MKIRILSDLHIDVNHRYPLTLNNKNVFTIIAGDTAGDPRESISWIRKNLKKGIIISGNHLVYNNRNLPVQDLKQEFAKAFPKSSSVTYLDQMTGIMSKEVNGILFIGTTLYTDYKLINEDDQIYSMRLACHPSRGINDFKLGIVRDKNSIRRLNPKDYLRWFIESKKEMTRLIESHPNQEIIIVTHHCPHISCYKSIYPYDNALSPSYASNLEEFIKSHPNIKLWITGHIHDRQSFKIGNCLIVQNPRGYEQCFEATNFNPNFFIETKDWSIHQEPFKCAQWEEERKLEKKRLLFAAFSLG